MAFMFVSDFYIIFSQQLFEEEEETLWKMNRNDEFSFIYF